MMKARDSWFRELRRGVFWLIMILVVLWALFPPVWLILNSFKNFVDVFAIPPKIFFNPTLVNYENVFYSKKIHNFLFNSLIIASTRIPPVE